MALTIRTTSLLNLTLTTGLNAGSKLVRAAAGVIEDRGMPPAGHLHQSYPQQPAVSQRPDRMLDADTRPASALYGWRERSVGSEFEFGCLGSVASSVRLPRSAKSARLFGVPVGGRGERGAVPPGAV